MKISEDFKGWVYIHNSQCIVYFNGHKNNYGVSLNGAWRSDFFNVDGYWEIASSNKATEILTNWAIKQPWYNILKRFHIEVNESGDLTAIDINGYYSYPLFKNGQWLINISTKKNSLEDFKDGLVCLENPTADQLTNLHFKLFNKHQTFAGEWKYYKYCVIFGLDGFDICAKGITPIKFEDLSAGVKDLSTGVKEDKQKAMLADDLTAYIKDKHTQEECIGFIDGYNAAISRALF